MYLRGPEQFSQQGWTALGIEEVVPKDAVQESPTHHLALWSCTENPQKVQFNINLIFAWKVEVTGAWKQTPKFT